MNTHKNIYALKVKNIFKELKNINLSERESPHTKSLHFKKNSYRMYNF